MENSCALLVIDMQNGFLNENSPQYIRYAKSTVPAISKVIASCRKRKIPVFFVTRSYHRDGSNVEHTRYASWIEGGRPISPGCGEDISGAMPEEFCPGDKDYYIVKPRYSAFFQTELDLMLRRLGIHTIILTGTTTPNCIRATCYDGISLDYNVAVLEDGTSSVTKEIQRANILDMRNVGAQILTCEEFIRGTEIKDNVSKVMQDISPCQ